MITILTFIIVLGILILAHEFGHFITAKKSGVKVEEFGIGFPPRLWGRKGKDGVFYSINWIPFGGFVKLKGEGGEHQEDQDSFANRPARTRALILSAGVLMNVVLAFVLFSVGFMLGLPATIGEEQINDPAVKNVKVQIASVVMDSPAYASGLIVGDQLLAIDNQEMRLVSQFQSYISEHQDSQLTLQIARSKENQEIKVVPQIIEGFAEEKVMGVTLIQTGIVRHNFFASWYYGLKTTVSILAMIVLAFYNLLKNLVLGLGVSIDLRGPVGVAIMTGQVVSLGWIYVLQFTAILSLNLAVINFFPFPALDGGRFLFLIIEKIRRRPNNQKVENLIHNIGFTILIILVLVVTYRDIAYYGAGFIEKIKGMFG
ncbi:M50 family metallopeptidase [Patescibacteria group bacterium]|nr:M50 family metallopeptidase [Patescibacteria group bacterium]